jgi:hypothetical protein
LGLVYFAEVSALGPNVGTALGDELPIGINIKSGVVRKLHPGKLLRVHFSLPILDEKQRTNKKSDEGENAPRGKLHCMILLCPRNAEMGPTFGRRTTESSQFITSRRAAALVLQLSSSSQTSVFNDRWYGRSSRNGSQLRSPGHESEKTLAFDLMIPALYRVGRFT